MKNKILYIFVVLLLFTSCSDSNTKNISSIDNTKKQITIFCVNDVHGKIENFSKIKYIVDQEKEQSNVILVSAGDLFSGNPVVDNHPQKGYPIIDLMNKIGFDVAVFGNHEFDYGTDFLKDRMEQSEFKWVCANVDTDTSELPEPNEYVSIIKDNIKLTFLGLVETNGKKNATIPSTHPWRVENLSFYRPENVVSLYSNIKKEENSDLYICLSHLGDDGNNNILGDNQLASKFPYFDLIIGGHSHAKVNRTVNGIPIFQSGSYLNYLGKIELSVINKKIENIQFELIDLNKYNQSDSDMKSIIETYNNQSYLSDVIGYSNKYHQKNQVGCFYTDALRSQLQVDICFQNTGGIRSSLNEGDITKKEVYEISPFNNGTVIYEMSVLEIKNFLKESGSGFYYSGVTLNQQDKNIIIKDLQGQALADQTILKVGLNDYIPAVHDDYFPENRDRQNQTDTETIISYLMSLNNEIDYPACDRYFRMQ
ncbi:bifunctional metallophosphatase/5'-nucleotidase [Marinifilum sp. RC60d5]|uniref:bifunctional metallophosphatase/5'-nucleotidase n=1 Tax=Marinifilum sp. RC60d5 TaxID=3458414 RepID=UPI0040366510